MKRVFFIFNLALILITSGRARALVYTITDLGTGPAGEGASAEGINESGQIVGWYWVDGENGYDHRPFLYDGTAMQDLGTLGGSDAFAWDINNNGQVVGQGTTSEGLSRAFLYDGTMMHDLGTLGGDHSRAYAINDKGQIVGTSVPPNGIGGYAFLYEDGTMHNLGSLGGIVSCASGINNSGQVVGQSHLTNSFDQFSQRNAFLYDEEGMHDLGTLGGSFCWAYDINTSGQVVGMSYTEAESHHPYHAFLYDGGEMQDLGTLGGIDSVANAINDSGYVVGHSFFSGNPNQYAFVFDGESMISLNDLLPPNSGWGRLIEAKDINNSGQIVGYGQIGSDNHAFLMTPVPEPVAIGLLAFGALGIRKKRK